MKGRLMRRAGALFLAWSCLLGTCAVSASCNDNSEKVASATTEFGFELFEQVVKQHPSKNIFVSPSSVAFALTMTYNGAAGTTQEAMARTLRFAGMDLHDVNRGHAVLKEVLENPDPQVQLEIANSLWARKGIRFRPEFLAANRSFYDAEVMVLDFRDPGSLSAINGWVNRKTKGKIDRIVDRIDPSSILFLINAVYFKGKWTEPFDENVTREHPFTLLDGRQKSHPMMFQSGRYRYLEGEGFQAVSLPYGEGRVSMLVFLPSRDSSLHAFHTSLSRQAWDGWMTRFRYMEGDIALPRLKLDYEATLNEALKALGMAIAFDRNRANFERMCPSPPRLYIDQVKHKTFVEINEEGTEAAAVTSVEMKATAMPPPEKHFTMVVDRPFFFAIRDNDTGTILFVGSIVEPTWDRDNEG
jgi:serine protease inhibitor